MKRFLTLVLIIVLVSMMAGAVAEGINLDAYNDNDLVNLLEQVQQEIADRNIEKTAIIKAGQYIGGKDIPVGDYTLHCKTDDDSFGIVWVSAANDNLDEDYPSMLYELITQNREKDFYIEIEEGGILNVPFSCELTISSGVMFQ